MRAAVDALFGLLKAFTVLCLLVMVVLVFGNVVLRYGFNSGITISEEMSRWAFLWLVFVGAVIGLRERAHLGVDIVVTQLPRQARRACFVVMQALMLAIALMVLRGCWQLLQINLHATAPVTDLSMAWYYASGVVFGALSLPVIAWELWRGLRGGGGDDDFVGVKESEEAVELPAAEARP